MIQFLNTLSVVLLAGGVATSRSIKAHAIFLFASLGVDLSIVYDLHTHRAVIDRAGSEITHTNILHPIHVSCAILGLVLLVALVGHALLRLYGLSAPKKLFISIMVLCLLARTISYATSFFMVH